MSDAHAVALATLVQAFHPSDWTAADVRLYTQKLQLVPVPVLTPMVDRAISTRTPRWGCLPTVAELLEDAEACRLELLKSLGEYDGCATCQDHRGWVEIMHADGVRAERCVCWKIHQTHIAQLGVGHAPLALPAAPSDWQAVGEK